jgi:hypothetical protein
MELPAGLISDALWGEDSGRGLRAAGARVRAARAGAADPQDDDGDARFGTLLRTAFAWAARAARAKVRSPATAPRSLRSGILRGHTKLERFTGPVLEEATGTGRRSCARSRCAVATTGRSTSW